MIVPHVTSNCQKKVMNNQNKMMNSQDKILEGMEKIFVEVSNSNGTHIHKNCSFGAVHLVNHQILQGSDPIIQPPFSVVKATLQPNHQCLFVHQSVHYQNPNQELAIIILPQKRTRADVKIQMHHPPPNFSTSIYRSNLHLQSPSPKDI